MQGSFSSPWPDPNSRILSNIPFNLPVSDVLWWLRIRDIFWGTNFFDRNIRLALSIASSCPHPNAVWISSIFSDMADISDAEARAVFLEHQDDSRALCFAWYLLPREDRNSNLSLIRRAADLGDPFAPIRLCFGSGKEKDRFAAASRSASACEREGFNLLGFCLTNGISQNSVFSCSLFSLFLFFFLSLSLSLMKDGVAMLIWTRRGKIS